MIEAKAGGASGDIVYTVKGDGSTKQAQGATVDAGGLMVTLGGATVDNGGLKVTRVGATVTLGGLSVVDSGTTLTTKTVGVSPLSVVASNTGFTGDAMKITVQKIGH